MVQAWQVNGSTVAEMTDTADAPLTYTVKNVTAKTEVSATLIERPTYTITVTSEGSGTASAEPASVKRGGSTTVTAVPSSNSYYLKEWSVNGGAAQAASGNTLALTEIRRNTTVKAVFDGAINYDVTLDVRGADTGTTVAAAANGKAITPQRNSPASVTRGSKVVFTATPAMTDETHNKQMVAQWTVNGVDQNNISNELVIPSLTGKTDVSVKFVSYEGFAIPTDGTGWKVSDVKRVPNDTQPTSEIRKSGELTFTVTPEGEKLFRKLTVNGVDCLAQPTTGDVSAVKNGASYTITIKDVISNIAVDIEAVEYQIAANTLDTVPSALSSKFSTIDELKNALRAKVNSAVTASNIAYLDIVLQYKNGTNWVTVTNPSDFPEGGMDVQVPYSTLAKQNTPDSSYNFSVVHMFTTTMNGQTVGGTESLTSTKQSNGITFHVNSLSPFAIGWYKNTSTGGGGGGGGAVAPTTYDIVIPSALANTVKADKTKAAAGDTVTLTAAGEGTLTVTDANGKTVALTDLGSGKYTFKMPSAKVSVGFETTADQPCDGGKDCPSAPFTDVDTAKWYHLSVDYVLTHKMMNGVSSRAFAPNANLTRGMLVQILYNLEGKPKGTAANFSDVQADAWYAEAVGWAASNKVVTGYADGTFRPNAAVTREQAAAILYRYAQSKGIDVSVGENTNILSYVDVQQASEYAIPALQWAVGAGVLNGKNGGRLAPTGTATRAEIAAIMQRWCENIIK
ncbi:MAG: S-layer homology domain-containing protein [Butyricicoccus sp.]